MEEGKLNDEEGKARENDGEPAEAPPCHNKLQPGNLGKLIWITGPPGAGKSTTCQLMARKQDYIYYEADCMMQMINPFTDLYAENPTMASFESKALTVC